MEDEAPRPDRAERQRNGLAKLVPTLKPRNGLNDSWRVGGWRPFQPRFNPLAAAEPPSTPFFLFFPSTLTADPQRRSWGASARRQEGTSGTEGRTFLLSFLLELPSSDPSRKLTSTTVASGFLKYRVLSLLSPR